MRNFSSNRTVEMNSMKANNVQMTRLLSYSPITVVTSAFIYMKYIASNLVKTIDIEARRKKSAHWKLIMKKKIFCDRLTPTHDHLYNCNQLITCPAT